MTIKRDPDEGYVIGTSGPEHVLDVMDAGKVYTTSEIAEDITVNVTHQSVLNWLYRLEDDGRVERRKPTEQLNLWKRTESE